MSARTLDVAAAARAGVATGLPVAGWGTVGPLAARLSLGPAHAAAARRHAERLESRGEHGAALEAWRLAIVVEPGVARAWRAAARCQRALGAFAAAKVMQDVAARLPSEGGHDDGSRD